MEPNVPAQCRLNTLRHRGLGSLQGDKLLVRCSIGEGSVRTFIVVEELVAGEASARFKPEHRDIGREIDLRVHAVLRHVSRHHRVEFRDIGDGRCGPPTCAADHGCGRGRSAEADSIGYGIRESRRRSAGRSELMPNNNASQPSTTGQSNASFWSKLTNGDYSLAKTFWLAWLIPLWIAGAFLDVVVGIASTDALSTHERRRDGLVQPLT